MRDEVVCMSGHAKKDTVICMNEQKINNVYAFSVINGKANNILSIRYRCLLVDLTYKSTPVLVKLS